MLINAYQTLNEFGNTSEGMHILFLYVAEIVPGFIPLLLFALFVITTLGSYFAQVRLSGSAEANFPASFAVGGYLISIVALMMTLQEGLINTFTLAVCIIVAILGTLWLFVSRD